MKIEKLRSEKNENRARVAATITWEDCARPAQELFFETTEAFARDLSCNPHAFLIGAIIPAMHYGEKRISIDAEICPELRNGLITAMSFLRHWHYGPERDLVLIEARTRSALPAPRTPERAGFFFSGGIDAFATLRANRLGFPLEHPWSIKDGLLVYGLEVDQPEAFEYVLSSLSAAAGDLGITLIPVYTNLYLDYRQEDTASRFSFWTNEFQGAAFSSIAHAFAQRLSVISLASSSDIPHLYPQGSHPLLDPYYSSADLRIRHDGIELSRFAKSELISDWDEARRHLRVCNIVKRYQSDMLNCGRCPKCVLTKLALLALGVLDKTHVFSDQEISPELILKYGWIDGAYTESCYRELINPLSDKGYNDLARAIEIKVTRYRTSQFGWKAKVRKFDNRYLSGSIGKMKEFISDKGRISS